MKPLGRACLPGFLLTAYDLLNAVLRSRRHRLMHGVGLGTFYEVRSPAITPKQAVEFLMADPGQ